MPVEDAGRDRVNGLARRDGPSGRQRLDGEPSA
jgi:hypothetical protein